MSVSVFLYAYYVYVMIYHQCSQLQFSNSRVFRLLSSSLLLFPEHFDRYVLRPSSGVCRTREPTQNYELCPLLNPRGSPVLIPLAITGYKYSSIVIEEGWRTYWPKRGKNNKNENNSLKTLNDKNQ